MYAKKLLLVLSLLIIPAVSFAYISPGKPTGFVNDYANVVTSTDKQSLESKLNLLRTNTGVEIAVVTIKSLGDETIESYAVKLFEEWGIGGKSKDTGLLLLVAINEKKLRIETGYGMEGIITDLQAGIIIRDIITPLFKSGNYSSGIVNGVDAMVSIINKVDDPTMRVTSQKSKFKMDFEFITVLVMMFLSIIFRILSKSKSWWLGGVIGAIVGCIIGFAFGFLYVGIGAIIVLTIIGFILDYIVSKNGPHSGMGTGFFGGFGGSGLGGGFGGFGGGRSGGGGSSGGW